MSDRWVFLTAFLTAILIVAGAFVLPQFFIFELAKSTIFVAIAVLVFFGEDRYSYMLAAIAPVLWFLADIVGGVFFDDFRVLLAYLVRGQTAALDSPLHALSRLMAIVLVVLGVRAWRKQVPERFFGKTFAICLVISLVYAGTVAALYFRSVRGVGVHP